MSSLLLALMLVQAAPAAEDGLSHKVYPSQPLIQRTRLGQAINFDVEVTNSGTKSLELTAIRAAVRDPRGLIVQRLEVNDNGSAPGIHTVPTRAWKPGEAHTIFNPFHTLAADVPLGRIDYEFIFRDDKKETVTETVQITPAPYAHKTSLIVPMPGRVLVWDGHDFYSHHRRWNFSHPMTKKMGLLTHPSRYSFDFVIADADGGFHRPNANEPEDYFSLGAIIVAPGDGTVVSMMNDAPDEPADPTPQSFASDPMFAIYGNYIVIDHGNGEFSQLGHLKKGSVRVRVGEHVRQGKAIAQAGASGTSLFPHLHYQLATRPGINGEGLPVYFDNVVRVLGGTKKPGARVWIDTGDIVETDAAQ